MVASGFTPRGAMRVPTEPGLKRKSRAILPANSFPNFGTSQK